MENKRQESKTWTGELTMKEYEEIYSTVTVGELMVFLNSRVVDYMKTQDDQAWDNAKYYANIGANVKEALKLYKQEYE